MPARQDFLSQMSETLTDGIARERTATIGVRHAVFILEKIHGICIREKPKFYDHEIISIISVPSKHDM